MAESEEAKKLESDEAPSDPPSEHTEAPTDIAEEKSVIMAPSSPDEKLSQSKPLALVLKLSDSEEGKSSEGININDVLARVEKEKRLSLIKAWEENEKSKAENKAHKKLSAIGAWESSKEAIIVAELKQIEERLEKEKAEYVEKLKNKAAQMHKAAEEKRATIEAKRVEEVLKAEEMAANYRATGGAPTKLLGFL
ncbi:remorin-like isoform X1 [Cornus florida]|uniref:remorin-like isoform X1 n=1 Tax=Cornus florida TaxID=4283 RepID=UPI00289CB563|nr:remorin-like isoform X1 [Cornus florida]